MIELTLHEHETFPNKKIEEKEKEKDDREC
jgi:hypothetical protein